MYVLALNNMVSVKICEHFVAWLFYIQEVIFIYHYLFARLWTLQSIPCYFANETMIYLRDIYFLLVFH